MPKISRNLDREINRFVTSAAVRRTHLLTIATRKSRLKKVLSVTSGILALFSAGAITTVLVEFIGNQGLQIIAAITAAVSGVITLIITGYLSDEDISKIFIGSSEYLSLRNRVYHQLLRPDISSDEVYKLLAEINVEYTSLDRTYAKYFGYFAATWELDKSEKEAYEDEIKALTLALKNVKQDENE